MRYLLLGLILTNVLYWTWSRYVDTPQSSASTQRVISQVPSLELVSPPSVNRESISSNSDSTSKVVEKLGTDDVIDIDEVTPDGIAQTSKNPSTDQPITVSSNLAKPPPARSSTSTQPDVAATVTDTIASMAGVIDESTSNVEGPGSTGSDTTDGANLLDSGDAGTSSALKTNLTIPVDAVRFPDRCVTVGPFANLQQAGNAVSALNNAGFNTSQRVEEAQVWVGHWVHLPQLPSREAAVEVVERLREGGVKDIYIEPSGELANSVSLGLFTDLARAETRAGEIRKLDVRPQIRDRHKEGLVYWIDLRLSAGLRLNLSAFETLPNQQLEDELVDCAGLAANN